MEWTDQPTPLSYPCFVVWKSQGYRARANDDFEIVGEREVQSQGSVWDVIKIEDMDEENSGLWDGESELRLLSARRPDGLLIIFSVPSIRPLKAPTRQAESGQSFPDNVAHG